MKKLPIILLSVATAGCIAAGTAAVLSEKQVANVEQGENNGNLTPAKKDISSLIVNTISDQIYTGQAITPAVIILDGQTQLVQDTDYTLQYADNIHVGTAHITITGTGNYTGIATINFGIVAPANVLNFEFDGNTITSYTGTDTEVTIPASYSLGKTITQTESVVFDYTQSGGSDKTEGTADGGHSLYNDVKTWLQSKFSLSEDKLNTMTSAIVYGNTSGDTSYCTYSINNTNGTHYDISVTYTYQQYVAGNDYQVTAIGNRAFWGKSIQSLIIPSTITSIGDYAFEQCSNLASVTIPSSVQTLGFNAFANNQGLLSVTIEGDIANPGNWTFNNCQNLTSVSMVNLTKFAYGMFANCNNLTSVTIPTGVTSIEVSAFSGSGLTSILIPRTVTTIGSEAFAHCASLISITFEDTSAITTIGAGAFTGCTSLDSVTLPATVTSVENFAFQNCNNLTTLKLSSLSMVTLGGMIVSDGTTIKVPQILLSSYQNTYPDYNFEREPAYDVTYQIKYINDGQSFQTSSSLNGDMAYCWASDPSKEGYTFLGWSTVADDSNYIVDKSTWTPTADTTLYAIYQVNNT